MPFIQSKQISTLSRADLSASSAQSRRVRIGIIALSCVLGIIALWQLTAVLMHPVVPYFVSSATTEPTGDAPAAARAAEIAQIRGDFWFDDALLAWINASRGNGAERAAGLDDAHAAAVRAAALAPHDARAWLLLALVDTQLGASSAQQAEALKMSYYTGPDDAALIPSRLALAVRSAAIADPDFQQLVSGEVLAAVRQPALHAAILSAYRQASPDGKRFLLSAVAALDSGLAGQMRATDGVSPPH
jgi:hypothetical protein